MTPNPWARLKAAAERVSELDACYPVPMFDELRAALAAMPADAPSETPLLDQMRGMVSNWGLSRAHRDEIRRFIAAAEARQAAERCPGCKQHRMLCVCSVSAHGSMMPKSITGPDGNAGMFNSEGKAP